MYTSILIIVLSSINYRPLKRHLKLAIDYPAVAASEGKISTRQFPENSAEREREKDGQILIYWGCGLSTLVYLKINMIGH